MFYFEEGPRDTLRLSAKTWLKMKDQKTLERFHDVVKALLVASFISIIREDTFAGCLSKTDYLVNWKGMS